MPVPATPAAATPPRSGSNPPSTPPVVHTPVTPTVRTPLSYEPQMVNVPGGPFMMGSPQNELKRSANEPLQYKLSLNTNYSIGKYPITVDEYSYFIRAGGYNTSRYWTASGWQARVANQWKEPRYWSTPQWTANRSFPVIGVSWFEAYAYCKWLSEVSGRNYTLPTEAQWEKAARGGITLPNGSPNPIVGRTFPWGNHYSRGCANCNEVSSRTIRDGKYYGTTSVVGAFPQSMSPVGAYDMSGNVLEWCLSKASNPYKHPEDTHPEGDSPRIVHGGSWANDVFSLRISRRDELKPAFSNNYLGFRCVRL